MKQDGATGTATDLVNKFKKKIYFYATWCREATLTTFSRLMENYIQMVIQSKNRL